MLEKVVNFFAFIGKMEAIFDIILGIFVGIIFLCIAIYLFISTDVYDNHTKGTVQNSLCKKMFSKKDKWDCSFNILYNIDNTEYLKNNVNTNSRIRYIDGNSIDLRYNPNNKNEITTTTWTNKTLAYLFLILSLLSIIVPICWYYFIKNNKNLAAVSVLI
jgi:hypothetical protein